MAAITILVACCAAWLPVALLQAPVPITTSLSKKICTVSQADLRVLPSQGFIRSLESSFQTATAPAPIAAIQEVAGCLFQSEKAEGVTVLLAEPLWAHHDSSRKLLYAKTSDK